MTTMGRSASSAPHRPSDGARERHLSQRAEYVLTHYLADNPDTALQEDVNAGRTSLERAYRILKETGARDPKTGIHRSDLLHYAAEFEMRQARKTGHPTTVGVFDIDHFKTMNTELTHGGADEVLKRVAQIMSAAIRASDDVLPVDRHDEHSVVRWGGEEFVLLFSGVDLNHARVAAERIRKKIETDLAGLRPNNAPVTVSGGLAGYDATLDTTPENWIRRADEQMFAAKAAGRNKIFPSENSKSQVPNIT